MNNGKFFLGVVTGGILILLLCCCCMTISTILIWNNPEFQREFKSSYCEEIAEGGMKLSEEPFGLCR